MSAPRYAYLGPAGTYSQQAAADQFGSGASLLPLASIDTVFDEVERGRAEYGVVPVENSTEGVVAQTLDRFISSPLTIKAEVLLRIDHCLLAKDADPKHVRRIVSHPQSLAQCRTWPIEPGGDSSSSLRSAWIESTSTAPGAASARAARSGSSRVSPATRTADVPAPSRSARSRSCRGDSSALA